jgi:hypothetical protein
LQRYQLPQKSLSKLKTSRLLVLAGKTFMPMVIVSIVIARLKVVRLPLRRPSQEQAVRRLAKLSGEEGGQVMLHLLQMKKTGQADVAGVGLEILLIMQMGEQIVAKIKLCRVNTNIIAIFCFTLSRWQILITPSKMVHLMLPN